MHVRTRTHSLPPALLKQKRFIQISSNPCSPPPPPPLTCRGGRPSKHAAEETFNSWWSCQQGASSDAVAFLRLKPYSCRKLKTVLSTQLEADISHVATAAGKNRCREEYCSLHLPPSPSPPPPPLVPTPLWDDTPLAATLFGRPQTSSDLHAGFPWGFDPDTAIGKATPACIQRLVDSRMARGRGGRRREVVVVKQDGMGRGQGGGLCILH